MVGIFIYLTSQNATAGKPSVTARGLAKVADKAAKIQENTDKINAAIGWISERCQQQKADGNIENLMKTAGAYLQDLKDGKIDYNWSDATKRTADFAQQTVNKFIDSQQGGDALEKWKLVGTTWLKDASFNLTSYLSRLSQSIK